MAIDVINGRFRARIRKVGYKAQTRTFRTRGEAERWARKIEGEMDQGIAPDVSALRGATVQSLFERFRDEQCPHRKGERWELVRIKTLIRDAAFMPMRLDQDIPAALRLWVIKRGTEVGAASVNRELNLVTGIFSCAIKEWGVPLRENPVHMIKRPRAPARGRERTWSADDLAKFKEAIGEINTPPRFIKDYLFAMITLSIESAMRLGELVKITKANTHLDEAWLHIGDTKNGDDRAVPLSKKAVEILRPFVEVAEEFVFPVNTGSMGVAFREVRGRAGTAGLRFHDTRHTAATQLSKKFSNVLELSAVTGHRSLQSLKRYYNPEATDLAAKMG